MDVKFICIFWCTFVLQNNALYGEQTRSTQCTHPQLSPPFLEEQQARPPISEE